MTARDDLRAGRRGRRTAGRLLVAVVVLATGLSRAEGPASAHTPHDDVSDVAVSPSFTADRTVFVIAGNRLLRSTDAGASWSPIARGLPRAADDGEALSDVAISPANPRDMYLASKGGGFRRSTDRGSSWQASNEGLPTTDIGGIAVAPTTSDVVLAAGERSGLYRSSDGGRTWSTVTGFERAVTMSFVRAGGDRALVGDGNGGISVSDDGGATWRPAIVDGDRSAIESIAAGNDATGAPIFAGTTRGTLLRSTDGGLSFSELGTGLPEQAVVSLALSPDFGTDRTMWASMADDGVFQSTDGGATWEERTDGLTSDPQAAQDSVADFGALGVARDSGGRDTLFLAGFDGLFRSDSPSLRWEPVETLGDYVVGLGVSPDYANDRTLLVTTYVKGAYRTTDAGETWEYADRGLKARRSPGTGYAPVRRLHNVVFSPNYAQDGTTFSATWTGVLKSTDRGRSWTSIPVGSNPAGELRQFVLAVSPNYASDQTVFVGTRQGEIFRSEQGGERGSWSRLADVGERVRSIVLSPNYSQDRTLYTSTEEGVFTSDDQGEAWDRTGPAGISILAMSPNFGRDGTVLAGTEEGLYVTRNKGRRWTELVTGPLDTSSRIEALAMSPSYVDDGLIMVSLGGEGLFRSVDRGETFQPVGADLLERNDIIADFSDPTSQPIQFSPAFATDATIYAYAGPSVVRSTDRGDSWSVVPLPTAAEFLKQSGTVLTAPVAPPAPQNRTKTVLAVVAAALVLAAALVVGWLWLKARSRYFIGLREDHVALFRGTPGGRLWARPTVVSRTEVGTDLLSDGQVRVLRTGVARGSRRTAERYLRRLEADAVGTRRLPATRI